MPLPNGWSLVDDSLPAPPKITPQLPKGYSLVPDSKDITGAGYNPINEDPEDAKLSSGRKFLDSAINFARPFATDAAIGGGTALGGPAVGMGAGLITDKILQHLRSQPEQGILSQTTGSTPGGIVSDFLNTGEQILGGKLINAGVQKLVRPAANAAKGYIDPQLQKLGATFSQYQDPNSYLGKAAKFVEDTFASGAKKSIQANSAAAGNQQIENLAAKTAGRSVNTVQSPQLHSQLIQQEAIANQKDLLDAADQFALKAKMYGPVYKDIVTGYDAQGQPLSSRVQINKNFDPAKYADAVQNHQAVATLHNSLFDEKGLKGLVNDPNNSAVPFIDKILADSQQLSRALKSSKLPIPGTGGLTSPQLTSDLKGYYINKLIDSASTRDPITHEITKVDSQGLANTFGAQKTSASVGQLFSKSQLDDLGQIFDGLAKTQQPISGGERYIGHAIDRSALYGGLEMAGSLLSGHTSFGLLGAVPATIKLSGYGIAKILQNPTAAATLTKMVSGRPLNLSQATIAREFSKVLNGVVLNAVNQDGSTTTGKIQNGQFQPVQNAQSSQTPGQQ